MESVRNQLQPRLERIVQFVLPVGGQFSVPFGDVEHVGGGSALCVNQAHLNVASKFGKRGTDVVEEPGAVQGDNFYNRTVRGAIVVEVDSCFHADFRFALFGLKFSPHQAGHVEVAGKGGDQILFQANRLRGIVVESVETIREADDIQHGSGVVGAGIRLQNI